MKAFRLRDHRATQATSASEVVYNLCSRCLDSRGPVCVGTNPASVAMEYDSPGTAPAKSDQRGDSEGTAIDRRYREWVSRVCPDEPIGFSPSCGFRGSRDSGQRGTLDEINSRFAEPPGTGQGPLKPLAGVDRFQAKDDSAG